MTCRSPLIIVAGLACLVAFCFRSGTLQAADPLAPQPNIAHIMIDDLGWQDVACYYRDYHKDEPLYETPHMDRLASRGIRFMQAYSPAMTCAPSRAAFLTGQ